MLKCTYMKFQQPDREEEEKLSEKKKQAENCSFQH